MRLKLGVVGFSEGNGHPYSWSAIFNGYDAHHMSSSDFPEIFQYLERETWPEAAISSAMVTSIWTQDRNRSISIAKAAKIPRVVNNLDELVADVDAVLLARDDAENHLEFAAPVLRAGKPIYIDKPIAHTVESMERLYDMEQYPGQIFTCSALRYAQEFELTPLDLEQIGPLREIHAITPKSWRKYAIHVIEPVLKLLGPESRVVDSEQHDVSLSSTGSSVVSLLWSSGIVTRFFALGDVSTGIQLHLFGERGDYQLRFENSFDAFKSALEDFVSGVVRREVRSPRELNRRVVEIIQLGVL